MIGSSIRVKVKGIKIFYFSKIPKQFVLMKMMHVKPKTILSLIRVDSA